MIAGQEIGLLAKQALLEDVLGTLVMLELEAMDVDRVTVGVAVQYVDHNLLETDNLNAEEHLFLCSACQRFGIWYSRPGTGISHPTHMQRFRQAPARCTWDATATPRRLGASACSRSAPAISTSPSR